MPSLIARDRPNVAIMLLATVTSHGMEVAADIVIIAILVRRSERLVVAGVFQRTASPLPIPRGIPIDRRRLRQDRACRGITLMARDRGMHPILSAERRSRIGRNAGNYPEERDGAVYQRRLVEVYQTAAFFERAAHEGDVHGARIGPFNQHKALEAFGRKHRQPIRLNVADVVSGEDDAARFVLDDLKAHDDFTKAAVVLPIIVC